MALIEQVRAFNRFYTRQMGFLNRHLPGADLPLSEARVLFELAQAEQSAADLGRKLLMDKAHLSRIVARFRERGLVDSRADPAGGKRQVLSLTAAGVQAFERLDRQTNAQLEAMLEAFPVRDRRDLATSLQRLRLVLGDSGGDIRLRRPEPGDIGWIVHRQAVLYNVEYGWDWTYEGLVAEILGRFVGGFDPAHEDAWVAEQAGAIVGSVFLAGGDRPGVAKLRLLYVEPSARGHGLGRRLVAACIERARELGYRELTLWTNSVLASARRIYQAAGFRLVEETPHTSFGRELIGQTWTLDLAAN